ncbi:MAG: 50S ribosomal protein L31 [Candidatus Brennerbacteria bacterium RIFOXYD1_FULL_41_16]|uniref:Large ribosomal subunit protein bL31 n=1 Tax=Candidatus Brennerbacteria bacterium RIFOXYD1_FULL_41_16 TaxID=1797529 RepID=A0A1G1XLK5_9BACT|nr:MAG: 50S ribosomal protein L31 [Parcubacteria group bacterium GW2011_GWB1_41_4]OGY40851.1 MAG: 50S ribosomal protein L31 [Candidatus Brennerbacteria bacterium RIFOXYD1_FULL_41_16]
MKKDIHPQYYLDAKIKCACGAIFEVGATKPMIEVEVCSQCHPFFTGKDKLIDAAGRVDKYQAKVARSKQLKSLKPITKKEKNQTRVKEAKKNNTKK